MQPLVQLVTKGTRNQSVGLLTIGGSMLICSALAEAKIPGLVPREVAQLLIIVGGLIAITLLFRGKEGGQQR